MNPFSFIYTEILFRPLLNLVVGITDILPSHNIGIAIIIVTIIVRLILLPSSLSQARHMRNQQTKMKDVQAEIKKINEKHKDDPQQKAQETMAAYKKAGINPAGGCLPLLIQLPILIALYRVFLTPLPENFGFLYSFVNAPENIQTIFLTLNLNNPSFLLGAIAGAGQFFLMRMTMKGQSAMPTQPGMNEDSAQMMQSMQKNMMYFFPAMTVFIALQLPAALSLYWVASTLFAIGQQYYIKRVLHVEGVPVA